MQILYYLIRQTVPDYKRDTKGAATQSVTTNPELQRLFTSQESNSRRSVARSRPYTALLFHLHGGAVACEIDDGASWRNEMWRNALERAVDANGIDDASSPTLLQATRTNENREKSISEQSRAEYAYSDIWP